MRDYKVVRQSSTWRTPINIAIVKYWGKQLTEEGEKDILPLNDSLSITLSCDDIATETTIFLCEGLIEDTMILGGVHVPLTRRLTQVLDRVRMVVTSEDATYRILIETKNNFPTASGMASSASGGAAFACALVEVYSLTSIPRCVLARLASGSACRSVYGGFVRWVSASTSEQCISHTVFSHDHWTELNILCLVRTSVQRKDVSSTEGMQVSARTSPGMEARVQAIPSRIEKLTQAIRDRDFVTFSKICMSESDELHKICQHSVPPLHYLNEDSYRVIKEVKHMNTLSSQAGGPPAIVAYTFDAGPIPFLFTETKNLAVVFDMIMRLFPGTELENIHLDSKYMPTAMYDTLQSTYAVHRSAYLQNESQGDSALSLLFHSTVGSGPKHLECNRCA